MLTLELQVEPSASPDEARSAAALLAPFDKLLRALCSLLGQDLTVVDTATESIVARGAELIADVPAPWFELCREVLRRGKAEFIAEHEPLLVLAVPLALFDSERYVAHRRVPFLVSRCRNSVPP